MVKLLSTNHYKGGSEMFLGYDYNRYETRYEKQMELINHLVLHEVREKKNINIDMKELYKILEILHDFRVID
ncbi:hypothetical protein EMILIAHAH_188 [Bacillus phage vB_BanH_Emiliahah]|nr:hypothetical protein EMILIAHAH_188 [Bacillus phage vB_BanH_Emiliahah]